jgi:Domain of unknown function (DUF4304)
LTAIISTADFKKHIAKAFGNEMRGHGYKGTGFEYSQETEDLLIAVYIEAGRWGGNCSVGFAIHPKQIKKNPDGKLDLKNLKIYQYEFKMSLTKYARGEWWDYTDDESTNLETLKKIMTSIKQKAFPAIEQFKATPNILETFEVTEMDDFHKNWTKKTGVSIGTTDTRFAWAMTILFENRNPLKAKSFANWVLANSHNRDDKWFGNKDLNRVLTRNNGG